MVRASIISVGNELLAGQVIDTNTAYISSQLLAAGVLSVSSHCVGDKLECIVKALRLAAQEADIVVITGGLGPTEDDLTRQAMAEFLGEELQLDQDSLTAICRHFAARGTEMPEINKVQALIPAGAKAIANKLGTAPGIMVEREGKVVVALPGVPEEMTVMFADGVLPALRRIAGKSTIATKKIRCFGAGESKIAEMLGELMHRDRNPLINCTVDCGVVTLTIVGQAKTYAAARQMVEQDEKRLRVVLGELVFGSDDETLAQVVGEKLLHSSKTLAVAESCTGGLLAELITRVAGASRYFTYGWVTYSNEAKVSELGVDPDLIGRLGAVSSEVAQAMAAGARRKADADYAIAITGVAGPSGGTKEKPVGLVYIAVEGSDGGEVHQFIFTHDRQFIRLRAAQTALNLLRLRLSI
jgi:nicotinamide-nucleotide amidase